MEQQNNREPNDQNDKQNRNEHNNDHPPTNNHQERDDQDESNAISKRNQQDTSHPFELEASALLMVKKMQMMKEKMNMMMCPLAWTN